MPSPRPRELPINHLRLDDVVDLDHFLLDLHGDVRNDVRVEPGVVLLLRLPRLGDAEALRVFERDVEHEAGLLLDRLDERRRDPVVILGAEPLCTVPNQNSHTSPSFVDTDEGTVSHSQRLWEIARTTVG